MVGSVDSVESSPSEGTLDPAGIDFGSQVDLRRGKHGLAPRRSHTVFNPQVNPVLQLRLWQEKSVPFPYLELEDLLLPWEGYLYGTEFITDTTAAEVT